MIKNIFRGLILCLLTSVGATTNLNAEDLILLHTNDTHSMIQPDKDGLGGIQRRKVLIDSVRKAEKNVLLVDAGDAVQGTLFFKFFRGEVEYQLMDMLGYDIRILGNHEFDNGIEDIAKHNSKCKSDILSSNYDADKTALKNILKPYSIKKVAGKKIGFIGLNINPKGLITDANIGGIVWSDIAEKANALAYELKHKKNCDMVVAITHIGYEKENGKITDAELAQQSRDIDIIIGGHSHTLLNSENDAKFPRLIKNLNGQDVLVAQCGKSGKYLGYIKIDLDDLTDDDREFESKLIRVDSRLDLTRDANIDKFLSPYIQVVDSVNSVPIAFASMDMSNDERYGAFPNWTADFAQHYSRQLVDSLKKTHNAFGVNDVVDFSIMNVGGIRQPLYKGNVSEGQILSAFPFSNRIVLVRIKGSDLREVFESMARKGGEAVSNEVRVIVDNKSLRNVLINGKPLENDRDYLVCTIDYLAWGNDDMDSLTKGEIIWADKEEMSVRILEYIKWLTKVGLPIYSDPGSRFVESIAIK